MQPAAVSRRVKKDRSRQKQDNSHRKKLKLPKRRITTKRQHNISKFIDTNEPAAKMDAVWYRSMDAGRSMVSVITYPKKKTTSNR